MGVWGLIHILETLTWVITRCMCPDVRLYLDPVLLCRAGLGTPWNFFLCLCCVRHHLKVGTGDYRDITLSLVYIAWQ
ncbi:hypothetical protein ACN38_g11289 [Penicillium nordicum]|uniref:Uncharacterized protein n=1 Tax=Penicillium nordicum TaxID=229535 RepID=A0A0M8P0G5_9EURO|nr:hypothetical protein ACN38_g11289 [Penicillium nordicum]